MCFRLGLGRAVGVVYRISLVIQHRHILLLVRLARRRVVDRLHGAGMQRDIAGVGGQVGIAVDHHARGAVRAQEGDLPTQRLFRAELGGGLQQVAGGADVDQAVLDVLQDAIRRVVRILVA